VLLVCGSLAASVLAVDLALLVLYGPVRSVESFYETEPRFGYRMRPGLEFVFANPYHGYRARVRTNSRGLRDDELVVPKSEGVFRILLLGDSVTAGLEVDKDETFEALCEKRLARHGPVEVVNCGVRGYNLDNILGFLEHEGLAYEPDLVVYVFVENDLTSYADFRPETWDVSRGFTLHGFLGRLASASHLLHRAEILRQMFVLRRQRDREEAPVERAHVPGGLYELLRNAEYDAAVHDRVTAERIARLADLSARAGAGFLLAGAPHREEIDPESQAWWSRYLSPEGRGLDFDGVRRYLDWVAARHGLDRLDPVPLFRRELVARGSFWFHKDSHLNERGHRLLAEALASHIESLPRFRAGEVIPRR
jgi:lysophospholipase L1-like esterase